MKKVDRKYWLIQKFQGRVAKHVLKIVRKCQFTDEELDFLERELRNQARRQKRKEARQQEIFNDDGNIII